MAIDAHRIPVPGGWTGQGPPLRRVDGLEGRTFLICVGAMKAATSWLFSQFRAMPDVAVSPLKEVHFFDAKFGGGGAAADPEALAMHRLAFHMGQPGDPAENLRTRPAFRASVDRLRMIYDDSAYFEHFASLVRPRTRVLADITPAYACIGAEGFRFMRHACEVQQVVPRLLFILRDPVERLWSHLRFLPQLNRGVDPCRDWPELLRDPAVLARSDYSGTILDMEQAFAPEEIAVLFSETLAGEGFGTLCNRLGIGPAGADGAARVNRTKLEAPLPEEARRAFREVLAPQYEFCRARFGAALPEGWG
ncbi:sulfotransferase [Mangrovicoccus sp. HB161399]|uniref:sulfotransferase n=1 Tax=Mangrovicoccus sp. HB161399 TaxID=2720392 RepID=UPI0020A642D3|nr:sulfotransferase [Mangrovicoccus sp. HB161399]